MIVLELFICRTRRLRAKGGRRLRRILRTGATKSPAGTLQLRPTTKAKTRIRTPPPKAGTNPPWRS